MRKGFAPDRKSTIMHSSSRLDSSAFTLVEILIVIAIIAIISVVIILVLNPAELLRESRDSNRLADMSTISTALGVYTASGEPGMGNTDVVYPSIYDPMATSTGGDQCQSLGFPSLPDGNTYQCAASSTSRKVDGTGWIPVNFTSLSAGSPIGELPIDPINTTSSGEFYSYLTNGSTYEVTAAFESSKYISLSGIDGGRYSDLYEAGTNKSLASADFFADAGGIPIAFVASGTALNNNTLSSITTGSMDCTGADFLVAVTGAYGNSVTAGNSMSDSSGDTWAELAEFDGTAGANRHEAIWYAGNASGSSNMTVTWNHGTMDFFSLVAECYSGVASSSPLDKQNGANGPSGGAFSFQPGSITPTQDGELIISGIMNNNGNCPPTIDSGFTIAYPACPEAGASTAFAAYIQPTAAAVDPTWTYTSGGVDSAPTSIASFKKLH